MIHGIVQGVFFRANTQNEALRLGLSGWVRNTPDGAVEAVAQGDQEVLEAFIAWCKRGPAHARVDAVEASWEEANGDLSGFHIRH